VSLEKSFGCHVDAASSIFPLGLNCPTSPSFEDRPQASAPKWPFICNFNRGGRGRERGLQYYLKMHNSLVADIAPDCARRMCACCLHLHVQVTHVHMFVGYLATNTFVTHCIYQSDTAIERYRKNQEDGIPRL